ncbi:pentatricopeptide repeat-containing protein At5g08305 [Ricinus communis]|uniref:pentatricopeptide repeat-containing protein At5g08305 n=1 Tax=Ricinus communis TaxID=3988 RepID=UPI00201A70E6|nr:pentatricopeptide repeat-containing protein At5g08305 [Ricinus communis]
MLNAPLLRRNAILNSCLINILDKCNSMLELKKIHALVITLGLSQDEPFVSKILSFSALSDSGNINYSCWVLFSLLNPTIFNWNTVIRGYSKSKNPNGSISVFIQMLKVGVFPDYLTYPFLVKASARLLKRELGFSIHAHIIKHGFESDRFISNSLVHMYASFGDISCARYVFDGMPVKNLVSWNSMVDGSAKCGNMVLARQLFDLMPDRDVLSWSSLIDGYVKNGDYGDAMVVFDKMRVSGPKPNEVTMVSVLCACAHLGALDKGRMMHHYVIDNKLPLTLVLCTSLVDMYAKCGAINEAFDVFRGIPAELSDVLLWNAMIGGLATHGLVKESLDLFKEMNFVGVKPDEITYLSLLHACAHGGLVKEAWYFFDCLGKHGMTLKIEHYACIVDVMARAGQIAKAYQFLCQMPIEPTASMLGALLNGCMNYGMFDLAEIVGRKLIELEPHHDGRYIGLSNVYASVKRWDEARNMRKAMERMGVRKSPGYSFVAINESLHRFIAHDKTHPSSELIYMMLSFIVSQMKCSIDHQNQEFFCLYDNFWD